MHLQAKNIQKAVDTLTDEEAVKLLYDWYGIFARDKQKPPPGDWVTWFLLSGRGFGKTRTGAEWVRDRVESGVAKRIALVAPTSADTRDVMVEGESGILAISPPWNMPVYRSSIRRLTWPGGPTATLYSAEEPDRLNGPQHDTAWSDEIGVWKYARATWDMLQFGLRLGDPKQIITSTPKVENISLIKEIIGLENTELVTGSTHENKANLAEPFFKQIINRYEGTRLGRQEINAEILDDVPGALWTRETLDKNRVQKCPELLRIVVALDPEASNTEDSAETGIIVAGIDKDNHGYVLADLTIKASPVGWGNSAISGFHAYGADLMIGEVNNGGDMVEYVIKSLDENVPFKKVHASRGKRTRAEPIASFDEQGRIHHVGEFPQLEDQLCSYTPETKESPDRLDARVWAFTELMLGRSGGDVLMDFYLEGEEV